MGGIPELLNKQMLIRAGDSLALANKIEFLLTHIDMANKEANRNYELPKTIMILFFSKGESHFINTLSL